MRRRRRSRSRRGGRKLIVTKNELNELLMRVRSLLPRHKERYDLLWQINVASWQFKDVQKSIAYYVRFKDDVYRASAKTHLSDLLVQIVALCALLDLNISEVWHLGMKRIQEHAKLDIYPKLWEQE